MDVRTNGNSHNVAIAALLKLCQAEFGLFFPNTDAATASPRGLLKNPSLPKIPILSMCRIIDKSACPKNAPEEPQKETRRGPANY
jgi:hypothetical protein